MFDRFVPDTPAFDSNRCVGLSVVVLFPQTNIVLIMADDVGCDPLVLTVVSDGRRHRLTAWQAKACCSGTATACLFVIPLGSV